MKSMYPLKASIWAACCAMIFAIGITIPACTKNNTGKPAPETTEPVANFSWTGTTMVPAEISFVNESKHAETYQWNFGNGQTSVKETPDKVRFEQPGVYEILLRASRGTRAVLAKKTIVISAPDKPVPLFSYSYANNKMTAPTTILLHNESTNADNFVWDINGTLYSTSLPPSVSARLPGDYRIKLTVTKGNGAPVSYEQTITIGSDDSPIASFVAAYHPYPYEVNEAIQLVNKSVNSDAWDWSFGPDGPSASHDQHPLVKFTKPGIYPVTLIARKGNLQSTPRTITFKIGNP